MITLAQMTERHIRGHMSRELQSEAADAADAADLEHSRRDRAEKSTARATETCCHDLSVTETGPLCICDAVGRSLESFVELFDRTSRCEPQLAARRRGSVHPS